MNEILLKDKASRIYGRIKFDPLYKAVRLEVTDFIEKASSTEILDTLANNAKEFNAVNIVISIKDSDYVPPFMEESYLIHITNNYNTALVVSDTFQFQKLERNLSALTKKDILLTKFTSRAESFMSSLNSAVTTL